MALIAEEDFQAVVNESRKAFEKMLRQSPQEQQHQQMLNLVASMVNPRKDHAMQRFYIAAVILLDDGPIKSLISSCSPPPSCPEPAGAPSGPSSPAGTDAPSPPSSHGVVPE